ncbi:MAG: SOS response-associated peptidase [Rhodoferax sp.]|nr:SOS response-associated peptidase [Rhodoferax sp.]
MCSHYQAIKERERYFKAFGVFPPDDLGRYDVWPGYPATFIRRPLEADSGDDAVPPRQAMTGLFGLVPHWAPELKIARHTFNARSETVASKPSFRDAWKHAQRCIVAADAFYEPDWRSGKAVATRIARADGEPMGIAGLWSSWKSPDGAVVHSFTMLTINAEHHALMRLFHKPADEKRMVVILPSGGYDAWLSAADSELASFLVAYPADRLVATTD